MRFNDIEVALGAVRARPGVPFCIRDAIGRSVHVMSPDGKVIEINASGDLKYQMPGEELADYLTWLELPCELLELSAVEYVTS